MKSNSSANYGINPVYPSNYSAAAEALPSAIRTMMADLPVSAWGLTMFENDDVDFYKERLNPENPNQVWFIDHWEDLKIRQETIKVKGGKTVNFKVRSSRHGPILNEVDDMVAQTGSDPVSF